jgi:hypothetical protein
MRRCKTCGSELEEKDFYIRSRGIFLDCKECHREKRRARYVKKDKLLKSVSVLKNLKEQTEGNRELYLDRILKEELYLDRILKEELQDLY